MERKNILFLTLCVGHQTEFQGGVREGRFTKCEKDVVFELKARDETFGWCAHTHIHSYYLYLSVLYISPLTSESSCGNLSHEKA